MNYQEYVKFLNQNNIKLFDYQYRISYDNIIRNRINIEQIGGGNGNFLQNKSKDELLLIVNIANSSQPNCLISLIN